MERVLWNSKLYVVATWIYRLALVNLLWILFTLVGGIIIGVFPATIAMFSVARKWLMGETDVPVFRTFKQTYKSDFIKGNLLGYLALMLGAVFFFNIKFYQSFEGISFLLNYVFVFLFLSFGSALLYLFPVFVHFKLSIFQYIKHAYMMILISPFWTLYLLVITFLLYYFTTQFLPLFVFFGFSLQVVVIMWISLKIFHKIETKHNQEVANVDLIE